MRRPAALTPPGSEPIVAVSRLEKYFHHNHVLRGCSLEVYPRETICLIGRSGSGKSTLLRCINFLEEPTAGTVEVDGVKVAADPLREHRSTADREKIRKIRTSAQMVFQEFNLFPHMKVIDNLIEGPIRVKGVRRDEASRPPRSTSTRSASARNVTNTRLDCRAARSNGWRSPAR